MKSRYYLDGARFRAAQDAYHLSVADTARLLGVSPALVSRTAAGEIPLSPSFRGKLAAAAPFAALAADGSLWTVRDAAHTCCPHCGKQIAGQAAGGAA